MISLSEVVPGVDILRETKVCHLDHTTRVNPGRKKAVECGIPCGANDIKP